MNNEYIYYIREVYIVIYTSWVYTLYIYIYFPVVTVTCYPFKINDLRDPLRNAVTA